MKRERWSTYILILFWLSLTIACGQGGHMANQQRFEEFEASPFFEDQMSARRPVPGTVARGELFVYERPEVVTLALLQEGQERFNINCAPCHGHDGYGDGMVTRRGFPKPPSYHTDKIRSASDQHYFEVITNGLGKMPPYGKKVKISERWAIIEYIRALQLSQNASLDAVPPLMRDEFLKRTDEEVQPE